MCYIITVLTFVYIIVLTCVYIIVLTCVYIIVLTRVYIIVFTLVYIIVLTRVYIIVLTRVYIIVLTRVYIIVLTHVYILTHRPSDPMSIGEMVMMSHKETGSKLKIPEKRKMSKRPYSYLAAMDTPTGECVYLYYPSKTCSQFFGVVQ